MPKKITHADEAADEQLLAALHQHPELKERVLAIMRLAAGQEGSARTADEIETLLIEEMRQLGQQAMRQWAQEQAGRVASEVRQQHPQSYRSKKNA